MKIVSLFGAKHGVGTTTTAALLHVCTPRSLLVAHDVEDVHSLLGVPPVAHCDVGYIDISDDWYEPTTIGQVQFNPAWKVNMAALNTARHAISAEVVVMDWGTTFPTVGTPILVTDNSYVALRRAAKIDMTDVFNTICIVERTRALRDRDVEAVLGEVTFIDRDSSVQRSCDAGLLTLRVPLHTSKPLTQLMEEACSSSSTH